METPLPLAEELHRLTEPPTIFTKVCPQAAEKHRKNMEMSRERFGRMQGAVGSLVTAWEAIPWAIPSC